ncbi:MAG TPA: acyltransferase [Gemmatimonadaceae bacterium]|nr:acyltransferase [Gemmatimonadaceae bacterium]
MTGVDQPVGRDNQSSESNAGREVHVVPLDGLRGLAVLMVMFGHFWLKQSPVNALQEWTYTFVQNGWVGVDLFFVLSGFLITGILLEAKGSGHYFRNFYARRTLRIFPLYWGFLFVYFVVLPNVITIAPGSPFATEPGIKPWFWLYASNMLSLVPGAIIPPGLNHFWSLAVEEQFYLIWPAIVFALSIKTLERTCIALVVAAFAFRLFLLTTPFHHTGGYVLLPARIDTLAIGAWLAIVAGDATRRDLVERLAPRSFVIALVALAVANLPDLRMFGHRVSMQTVGFPLMAVIAASLIAIGTGRAGKNSGIRGFFSSRILVTAGKYSYAMYVFHLPLVIVLEMAGLHMKTFSGGEPPGILAALAYSAVMSVATFLVALASWHLYEKHFLKLKRLFPRRETLSSSP